MWLCDELKGCPMSNRPPRVTLPGQMYQRNGRWWWKVRLPGEPRVRARALRPKGARVAPKSRKVAEKVACERWRLSIEAETEARVRSEIQAKADKAVAKARAKAAEAIAKAKMKVTPRSEQAKILCAGKTAGAEGQIEQAKAQFEQRMQAYRDALAEARQKAQAEAEARTKAQAIAQAEASLRAELEQRARAQSEALAQAEARAQAEATLRAEAEQRAQMETQARAIAEARAQAEAELRSEAEQRANSQAQARMKSENRFGGGDSAGRRGPCEGCGRQDVPENDLARIDSGQLVCPDCLMLIRA